jgi:ribA/ribD-fused uncharacterized protein
MWTFSNFQPAVIADEFGIVYTTVEHAYQAAKTLIERERLTIALQTTPGKAKRAGRTLTLRPRWDEIKDEVMLGFLRQKFRQEPWHGRLVAAQAGELSEENWWHDTYWGRCICTTHNGAGLDRLGTLLRRVQAELLAEGV